jgi:predicted nucleotide-binding protein
MARKNPPPPSDIPLSVSDMRQGIERLRRRISDLEKFEPTSVKERSSPEVKAIEAGIEDTLSRVFGHDTARYRRYHRAASLDWGPVIMAGGPTPPHEVHRYLTAGKQDSLALLNQAVTSLEEDLAETSSTPGATPAPMTKTVSNAEIFVVHGINSAAKTEVARCIERAGLKAVVLHEQPNEGKTIIEKFEKHGGAAGFAVIVATPDDVGGSTPADLKSRARQNVIGEMFWFAGRLGRERVCALIKGDIEMPSDFAGVGYTRMDENGGWKTKLLQELDAAGYKDLDWKKALS